MRETTAGYSISFVAARAMVAGGVASFRADFRSMEQLTAEIQGSSESETSRYLDAYVPQVRDRSAQASYGH